jgi:hypothetical protein
VLDSVRASACGPECDVVTGVVYDSLGREPLAGAVVSAMPAGVVVQTDSLGRFVVRSAQRIDRVIAYHDALDVMGLPALEAVRPSEARHWTDVQLATPSLLTVWPRLCGSRRPMNARATVLQGTLRLSDQRTRVAGARVQVQWARPTYASGGDDPRVEEVLSDSLGRFLVCGVEEFVEPALVALAREAQSGVIQLPSDARPIRRVDLLMARTDDTTRATLRGRVVNESRQPVSGVRVGVDGADVEARSDDDGRFVVSGIPRGSRSLWTRGIGFTPTVQAIDITDDSLADVTIVVPAVIELDGVVVTARRDVRAVRAEFDWRRRAGWGRFLDSTDVMKAPHVRAALSMLPGITVRSAGNRATTEFAILGRFGCGAHLYLDGTQATLEDLNAVPPMNIAAIEVYSSVAFAPASLIQVRGDNCAVVAFWTKWALRP